MANNSLFDIAGQVVFVTGAASGLGFAMAEVTAEYGADVILADVDGPALEQAVQDLKGRGYSAASVLVDIGNNEQLNAIIDRCASDHGGLDVVFANAGVTGGLSFGISPDGQIDTLDLARWDKTLQINLNGTFYTMRAAARHMKKQKSGRIIVTASISGLRSSPITAYSYIAAKSALVNLVRQAAIELAPYNVLVNAIAPGCFVTNLAGERFKHDMEAQQLRISRTPLGRLGCPDDIKGLALFLAAPASSYITGTVIPIDGGVNAS